MSVRRSIADLIAEELPGVFLPGGVHANKQIAERFCVALRKLKSKPAVSAGEQPESHATLAQRFCDHVGVLLYRHRYGPRIVCSGPGMGYLWVHMAPQVGEGGDKRFDGSRVERLEAVDVDMVVDDFWRDVHEVIDLVESMPCEGGGKLTTDYSGDDYPREGCVVAVDVQRNGFQMKVFDPSGRILETYRSVSTAACVARMLEEWCAGKIPGLSAPQSQSASRSTETE